MGVCYLGGVVGLGGIRLINLMVCGGLEKRLLRVCGFWIGVVFCIVVVRIMIDWGIEWKCFISCVNYYVGYIVGWGGIGLGCE